MIDQALFRDPNARPERASILAERIRQAVAKAGLENPSAGLRQVVLDSASDQVIRLAGLDRPPRPPTPSPEDPATRADLPQIIDTVIDIDPSKE